MQTGLRIGELAGYKWSDVDWKKQTLTITRSMEYRHSVGEWKIDEPKSRTKKPTNP